MSRLGFRASKTPPLHHGFPVRCMSARLWFGIGSRVYSLVLTTGVFRRAHPDIGGLALVICALDVRLEIDPAIWHKDFD